MDNIPDIDPQETQEWLAALDGVRASGLVPNTVIKTEVVTTAEIRAIGDSVRIIATDNCVRCVMTTLPQGELPFDPAILHTVTSANRTWAGIYAGVRAPGEIRVGDPVMLDGSQRAGILTQAAFLTRWAHGNQTSPVHRGKLVRLNVMCGYVPPPPANAPFVSFRKSSG